jgi:hypothetical protein
MKAAKKAGGRNARGPKLSKAAGALRDHLAATGDSIAAQISGEDLYWSLTLSGVAIRGRDVRELRAEGLIEPFGGQIDTRVDAACYVLKGAEPTKMTAKPVFEIGALACGKKSVADCAEGFCRDCAPLAMCERIRAGKEGLPSNWLGPRP